MKNAAGTIAIAIAILIGCLVLAGAYKYKFKTGETISVTGLAEKDFESDQDCMVGQLQPENDGSEARLCPAER
ncbi:MAG TPA: hypothetical protein VL092_01320 [Chitinophagaceae bacterium]|nr:hypothetical protein [Chitinophagaceae bacterium]